MPLDATPPQDALMEVEALMRRAVAAPGPMGQAAAGLLGGKRMRAGLALAAASALDVPRAHAVAWAACCALVHEASLVLDDLQDGTPTRRGAASAHLRHGTPLAISLGVHLLASATALAAETGPGGAALLADAVRAMGVSQAREFDPALWASMSPDAYETLAEGKAGRLIALAVEGPALLAGLPAAERATLRRAACRLGAAYQITDDLADLVPARAPWTGDLARGGLNAVLVQYLDAAGPAERRALLGLLTAPTEPGRAGALLAMAPAVTRSGAPAASRAWCARLLAAAEPAPHALAPILTGLAARIAAAPAQPQAGDDR